MNRIKGVKTVVCRRRELGRSLGGGDLIKDGEKKIAMYSEYTG